MTFVNLRPRARAGSVGNSATYEVKLVSFLGAGPCVEMPRKAPLQGFRYAAARSTGTPTNDRGENMQKHCAKAAVAACLVAFATSAAAVDFALA